jgi:hypothetical protein
VRRVQRDTHEHPRSSSPGMETGYISTLDVYRCYMGCPHVGSSLGLDMEPCTFVSKEVGMVYTQERVYHFFFSDSICRAS